MPSLSTELTSAAEALKHGWTFVGVYPQPGQPAGLHNRFSIRGYQVADLPFDQQGQLVPIGSYALWAHMGEDSILADCGCVNHAEEGVLCEHDIALCLKI